METLSQRWDGSIAAGAIGAPDGAIESGEWLTRQQACAILGIKLRTWVEWERLGKVPAGAWGLSSTGKRCRLYSAEVLQNLKGQLHHQRHPYPDPGLPGVYRLPVASGKGAEIEVLIDAVDLPLAEGRAWYFSPGRSGHRDQGMVVLRTRSGPRPSLGRILLGITDSDHFFMV
ncbi:MAG TPA: hypothetical protein VF669_07410 [Tepidisphaeraceae bacterium]|jgi:hypothetical protein